MELLGLILGVPLAGAASATYAWLVLRLIAPRPRLSHTLRALSWLPVGIITTELVLVGSVGAVAARGLVGPIFIVPHMFILATPPALINLIELYRRPPSGTRAVLAGIVSWVACIGLVMFNIAVSEAWYGVDGSGGPYGTP